MKELSTVKLDDVLAVSWTENPIASEARHRTGGMFIVAYDGARWIGLVTCDDTRTIEEVLLSEVRWGDQPGGGKTWGEKEYKLDAELSVLARDVPIGPNEEAEAYVRRLEVVAGRPTSLPGA